MCGSVTLTVCVCVCVCVCARVCLQLLSTGAPLSPWSLDATAVSFITADFMRTCGLSSDTLAAMLANATSANPGAVCSAIRYRQHANITFNNTLRTSDLCHWPAAVMDACVWSSGVELCAAMLGPMLDKTDSECLCVCVCVCLCVCA